MVMQEFCYKSESCFMLHKLKLMWRLWKNKVKRGTLNHMRAIQNNLLEQFCTWTSTFETPRVKMGTKMMTGQKEMKLVQRMHETTEYEDIIIIIGDQTDIRQMRLGAAIKQDWWKQRDVSHFWNSLTIGTFI